MMRESFFQQLKERWEIIVLAATCLIGFGFTKAKLSDLEDAQSKIESIRQDITNIKVTVARIDERTGRAHP